MYLQKYVVAKVYAITIASMVPIVMQICEILDKIIKQLIINIIILSKYQTNDYTKDRRRVFCYHTNYKTKHKHKMKVVDS